MKRSPLRRRTPLRRKAIKRSTPALFGFQRSKPRRAKPGDDPGYLKLVRRLPCLARLMGTPCRGRMHAHHAGADKGTGMKAPDRTAIPLCSGHHLGEWHAQEGSGRGVFAGWTKARRREWSDVQIAATQAVLDCPPFDAAQDRIDEGHESWTVSEVQVDA